METSIVIIYLPDVHQIEQLVKKQATASPTSSFYIDPTFRQTIPYSVLEDEFNYALSALYHQSMGKIWIVGDNLSWDDISLLPSLASDEVSQIVWVTTSKILFTLSEELITSPCQLFMLNLGDIRKPLHFLWFLSHMTLDGPASLENLVDFSP